MRASTEAGSNVLSIIALLERQTAGEPAPAAKNESQKVCGLKSACDGPASTGSSRQATHAALDSRNQSALSKPLATSVSKSSLTASPASPALSIAPRVLLASAP